MLATAFWKIGDENSMYRILPLEGANLQQILQQKEEFAGIPQREEKYGGMNSRGVERYKQLR
jgi:hypothetical protein